MVKVSKLPWSNGHYHDHCHIMAKVEISQGQNGEPKLLHKIEHGHWRNSRCQWPSPKFLTVDHGSKFQGLIKVIVSALSWLLFCLSLFLSTKLNVSSSLWYTLCLDLEGAQVAPVTSTLSGETTAPRFWKTKGRLLNQNRLKELLQ